MNASRICICVVTVLLLSGAVSQAAISDPNAAIAKSVTFDDVLKLWTSGQKEQFLKSFQVVDWSRADIFAADSIFRISEDQFAKLPESKRTQVQQQAMDASKNIKESARFVVEQAKQSGQQDKYRNPLLACANRLSANDQLALIQMVAKAVKSYTERELGAQK